MYKVKISSFKKIDFLEFSCTSIRLFKQKPQKVHKGGEGGKNVSFPWNIRAQQKLIPKGSDDRYSWPQSGCTSLMQTTEDFENDLHKYEQPDFLHTDLKVKTQIFNIHIHCLFAHHKLE